MAIKPEAEERKSYVRIAAYISKAFIHLLRAQKYVALMSLPPYNLAHLPRRNNWL
jgi:hypothetical protein